MVTVTFLWERLQQPQFYYDLTQKTAFIEGWSWFKFNNLGLVPGTNLKFYTSVIKGLKLKVRKFLGLFPTFVEVTWEKLVGGGGLFAPLPPPTTSWIRLKAGITTQDASHQNRFPSNTEVSDTANLHKSEKTGTFHFSTLNMSHLKLLFYFVHRFTKQNLLKRLELKLTHKASF